MKKYILALIIILTIPLTAFGALTPVSWIRDTVAGFVRPGILTDTLRIPSLTNCDTIDTDADGDFTCGTDGGGGGGSIILDLADNGVNESSGIAEIATSGDTNSIFSEPSSDKLLINLGLDWPKADLADALNANGANCSAGSAPLGVDASGASESCTDFEEDLSNSAGLASALSDETGTLLSVFSDTPTFTTRINVPDIRANGSGGFLLEASNGTDIGQLGAGNTANVTWYGSHNFDTVTASRVAQFSASKTLESSSVTTTELGYLSGVTFPIQTALDGKLDKSLAEGRIFIGDSEGVPQQTNMSGDVTISSSGVTTIANDAITESKLKTVDTATDEECLTYESTVGDFEWQTCGGGGGTSVALDLADDGSNESSGLTEFAVTGDTNSIFTEPSADKLLVSVGSDWPKSDVSDTGVVVSSSGDTTSFFAIFDSETGNLALKTDTNLKWNATSNILEIDGPAQIGGNARPVTNDGGSLGTSTFSWSDLFLASGAVINFNAGDVTLTHSLDTLTMAGGTLVLPSSGLQIGSSNPFSDSTGTLTLQNVDAIDATTESTLESAIDIAGDISGTGLTAVTIGSDKILESMLKAVDTATDEECLTYEATVGDFEWQTCGAGGSGDITGVGDVASGEAFNGTAGTILTFNDTDGDRTLEYDNTNNWFEFNSILNPATNDGATLGNATQSWSDLFLASGGVINWNNGNATLTHSAGLLTSNVPLSLGTSNALTAGSIELGNASDTTLARNSAGQLNIEGVQALTASNTVTVTNKTISTSSNVLDACLPVAVTDDFSNLTTGTAKVTFRMPFAMTVSSVRASLVTAGTGGTLVTVDINESGSTILSTKITLDASERTSTTAVTAPVISDSSLADNAEMTVDIDAVGSTTPGNGLKIQICGTI